MISLSPKNVLHPSLCPALRRSPFDVERGGESRGRGAVLSTDTLVDDRATIERFMRETRAVA